MAKRARASGKKRPAARKAVARVKPIPPGYHSVTPYLTVRDAARAIRQRALRFLQHIYDFDLVSIRQVGPAQRGKVGKRLRGVLRTACDIKPELEYGASTHGGFNPIREWA